MIIVLGGNSSNNHAWVSRISQVLRGTFNPVIPVTYGHWELGGEDIDFESELHKLRQSHEAVRDYVIVAKSAGILLALEGVRRGFLNPQALIAVGTPLRYAEYRGLATDELYRPVQNVCKVLCIQQAMDPQGASTELKKILPKGIDLLEIPGDDHAYNNVAVIVDLAQNFFQKNKIKLN